MAASTSGWSNGSMPMIETATAVAISQRKNSCPIRGVARRRRSALPGWPASFEMGPRASSSRSSSPVSLRWDEQAVRRLGVRDAGELEIDGDHPLPCLPVDSASNCSSHAPSLRAGC